MVVGSTTKLLLCLLVVYCCTVVTEGQQLIDCCTKLSKQIDKRWVKDYRHQVAGQGCDMDATIFVTRKKNVHLCAPSTNEKWVEELMKHVDKLKRRCMNNNYKEQRCHDLKPKMK